MKAPAYLYIGGLKTCALRAYLITNWEAGKCASLIDMPNNATKNNLWRLSGAVTRGSSGSFTTYNWGKVDESAPF